MTFAILNLENTSYTTIKKTCLYAVYICSELRTMAEVQAAVAERVTLTATTEYACYPPASQQACWATASLKAPFYEPTSRAPVDIVAVIDKSGSMQGGKLELVKKTLLFVVDQCKSSTCIT